MKKQQNINLYENGHFITNQNQIADKFNLFFTNIGPNLSNEIDDLGKHFMNYMPPPLANSFFITPTTPEEVVNEIKLLSLTVASDILIKLIKIASAKLSKTLCGIFNHSFETSNYPDKLKFATVTPAHKADSKMSLNDYRPISVLPVFSKILERLMHRRLMNFLTKNDTLFDHQYGFQTKKTTSMAILDIYSKIVVAFENNEIACSIFLDFAKAFDTVDHNILLSKLDNYGIRGMAQKWFRSYLFKRQQIVKINDNYSTPLEIRCGVTQGSVLGPLLFLIYINDIYRTSKLLKFHLFADDTCILSNNKNVQTIEKTLNKELKYVSCWLSAN